MTTTKLDGLQLSDEFPAKIAEPLIKFERCFRHGQHAHLLAFLTGVSACHNAKTRFIISRKQHFEVPLNLFSGIVGVSGSGKSPLVEFVVQNPFSVLEGKDPNPKERYAKTRMFNYGTDAAVRRLFLEYPDRTLLFYRDGGLPNILVPRNQSSWARVPNLVEYYDGGIIETKKGNYHPLMSVLATGVPALISEHINKNKISPIWPRFLWAQILDINARYLPENDGDGGDTWDKPLIEIYQRTAALPVMNYVLAQESKELFSDSHNNLVDKMISFSKAGMGDAFAYAHYNMAKLIANCHVVYELAEGKEVPAPEIPVERVQQGIRLIHFFLQQMEGIRAGDRLNKIPASIKVGSYSQNESYANRILQIP